MNGIVALEQLLASLSPGLQDGEYVFISQPGAKYGDGGRLNPIAAFVERQGLTLVVPRERADTSGESYSCVFRLITLQVRSSLEAVGLTAAVAGALSKRGISTNVIAAFHHDHILVPASRAQEALSTLVELSNREAQVDN